MKNRPVLVLNADYTPISLFPLHIIPAPSAIVRIYNETCYVVEEYDDYIASKYHKIKYPSVIVRKDYLKREKVAVLNRRSLWYRDLGICAHCGTFVKYADSTIDHFIPRSKGGRNVWENTVINCKTCNNKKGNDMPKGMWSGRFGKPWKPTFSQLIKQRRKFPINVHHESWVNYLGKWNATINIINS